jgi:hypothetical protein
LRINIGNKSRLISLIMPVIEILNPQDPIPEVKSNYTIIDDVEVELDLNEDIWCTEYFVVFFHSGPSDPVSTSTLRALDKRNEALPCKVDSFFSSSNPYHLRAPHHHRHH